MEHLVEETEKQKSKWTLEKTYIRVNSNNVDIKPLRSTRSYLPKSWSFVEQSKMGKIKV